MQRPIREGEARRNWSGRLGEKVAEEIKAKIGSADVLESPLETQMRGRDLVTGLPKVDPACTGSFGVDS